MASPTASETFPPSESGSARTLSVLSEEDEHQASILVSDSLPRSVPEDFLGSSPPAFNDYGSSGDTNRVPETPMLGAERSDNDGTPSANTDEPPSERTRLQTSMTGLREQLNAATGIINNLRTRNQIHEIENITKQNDMQKAQHERRLAWEKARDDAVIWRSKSRFLARVLGLTILAVVVYGYWCWFHGPEMSYIRQRRQAVLTE